MGENKADSMNQLGSPQDSFYNSLDPESSKKAFQNDFDFDSPSVQNQSFCCCLTSRPYGKIKRRMSTN